MAPIHKTRIPEEPPLDRVFRIVEDRDYPPHIVGPVVRLVKTSQGLVPMLHFVGTGYNGRMFFEHLGNG